MLPLRGDEEERRNEEKRGEVGSRFYPGHHVRLTTPMFSWAVAPMPPNGGEERFMELPSCDDMDAHALSRWREREILTQRYVIPVDGYV